MSLSRSRSLSEAASAAAASVRYITKVVLSGYKGPFGCWDSWHVAFCDDTQKWPEWTARRPQTTPRQSGWIERVTAEKKQTHKQSWAARRQRRSEGWNERRTNTKDARWGCADSPHPDLSVVITFAAIGSFSHLIIYAICYSVKEEGGFFFVCLFFLVQSSPDWLFCVSVLQRVSILVPTNNVALQNESRACPPTGMRVVLFLETNCCKMSNGVTVQLRNGPRTFSTL